MWSSLLKVINFGYYKLDLEKEQSKSAVKIAVDMVREKLINKNDAVLRVDPNSLDTLLHPTLDERSSIKVIANGLPASPGAVSGKVVFQL